jgi:hypothetical protein
MEASTASREELSKLVKVYFSQLTKGEWEWFGGGAGGIDCHVVETTTHSCIGHLSSPSPNTTRENKESCDGAGRRTSCTPPHRSGFIA